MSKKREAEAAPAPAGAARWIPAYAALNTILLAFFITMSVSIMGDDRELGYMGPGMGAFKEGFTSRGLPSVLRGARSVVNMFTWGGKYVPEEEAQGKGMPRPDVRMTEPPSRDLKQVHAESKQADVEVGIPLPISHSEQFSAEDRERLSAAGRLIRLSGKPVQICASIPVGKDSAEKAWREAASWAMRAGKYLHEKESIPADKITTVGRASEASGSDAMELKPTMMLVMLPESSKPATQMNLFQQPQTEYLMIPQNGR